MVDTRSTTVIRSFPNEAGAYVTQLHLVAMGIEAWIQKDDGGGAYPPLQVANGVHVVVRAADAEQAREILEAVAAEEEETTAVQAPVRPSRRRAWPLFAAGLLAGALATVVVMTYLQHRKENATMEVAYDNTGDGATDEVHFIEKGQLVRIHEDRNGDGKMDAWTFFTGDQISAGHADDNFDGRADSWFDYTDRYTYRIRTDTNFDGRADVTSFVQNGVSHQADWHPGASTRIERRIHFDDGVRAAMHTDTNGDGRFDITTAYDVFERETGRRAYAD